MNNSERFAFGENWTKFLSVLNDDRIRDSEKALQNMLGVKSLNGKSFLDIGSGSGLSSLAARRLGAKVHSFDYDPQSVACTRKLRENFFSDDENWKVEQGSAIDSQYLDGLGVFDVVYSWGVLHHTGEMWLGIENAIKRVSPGGCLFIAIYNDQGCWSHVWWLIKHGYNKLPNILNRIYGYFLWYLIVFLNIIKQAIKLKPMNAIQPLLTEKSIRGMNKSHDIIDWMGGFPFEFAKYEVLENYLTVRGFRLVRGIRDNGLGCHEMVFQRE